MESFFGKTFDTTLRAGYALQPDQKAKDEYIEHLRQMARKLESLEKSKSSQKEAQEIYKSLSLHCKEKAINLASDLKDEDLRKALTETDYKPADDFLVYLIETMDPMTKA